MTTRYLIESTWSLTLIQPRRIDDAYRAWTQREEQLLLRLRGANATLDEIARRPHPRSRQAISKRINELIEVGILERTATAPKSNRPWSPQDDELVSETACRG